MIGDGWTLGRGARVSHSVLWERYPRIGDDGQAASARQAGAPVPHEVCPGVTVEGSILVSGVIETDVRQGTVERLDDGSLCRLSIDYFPDAPRA